SRCVGGLGTCPCGWRTPSMLVRGMGWVRGAWGWSYTVRMSDMVKPAPGWYDDVSAPGVLRWWDGNQWSEQRMAKASTVPTVVVNQRKTYKTSHGFHLIMTILTAGLWAIFV